MMTSSPRMKCILKRRRKTSASVIFVHGFTDSIYNKHHKDKWKKSLNRLFRTADLFYFDWDADSKINILFRILQKGIAVHVLYGRSLFIQAARIFFDSLLELKDAYETAMKEADNAGQNLRKDIENVIKKDYADITIVGHSLGAKVVQNALDGIKPNIIGSVYLCGAVTPEKDWGKSMKAVKKNYSIFIQGRIASLPLPTFCPYPKTL